MSLNILQYTCIKHLKSCRFFLTLTTITNLKAITYRFRYEMTDRSNLKKDLPVAINPHLDDECLFIAFPANLMSISGSGQR